MSDPVQYDAQAGSHVMSNDEIDRTFRVAKALAASGMFKDARQPEQAFAQIMIGRDLGLSPTQAMMSIQIIQGKPELSANLQASFVKRSPRHDYKVVALDDQRCSIEFYRDDQHVGTSDFTMDDAKQAGLTGQMWSKYPRNMLWARAISNGVNFFCPEVTGGVRVYSEGEISGNEVPREVPPGVDAATGEITAAPQRLPDDPSIPLNPEVAVGEERGEAIAQMMRDLGLNSAAARRWLGDAGVLNVPQDGRTKLTGFFHGLTPEQADALEHRVAETRAASEQQAEDDLPWTPDPTMEAVAGEGDS